MPDLRQDRGVAIAEVARIDEAVKGLFLVPSQTNPRQMKYQVNLNGVGPTCTCEDFQLRNDRCKHIHAVEHLLENEAGNRVTRLLPTNTDRASARPVRKKSYGQNWKAYNTAQVNEQPQFQRLLHALCKDLERPRSEKPRRGRPPLSLPDVVFAVVMKTYSTVSGRRFVCDLIGAQEKGYVSRLPHYNSIFNYFDDEDLTPILLSLIEQASLPLRSVETDFAVDSTGFTACRYVRWFDLKYNKYSVKQGWVKAHICTGVKTNVITAVEIHDKDAGDATQLPALVEATAKNFRVAEVSADKGYSCRDSHDAIAKVGATPYIAFRNNTTGGVGGLFAKMYHYFQYNREDFLAKYHKRSNVESTVMMVKSKFGDSVRSKTDTAQKNEVLTKVLAHNICCLISAIYELGIEPTFGLDK